MGFHQELLGGGYRDLALSFCRLRRLAPAKAEALAERLEFLTRRLPAKGEVVAKAKAKVKAKAKAKAQQGAFSGKKMGKTGGWGKIAILGKIMGENA